MLAKRFMFAKNGRGFGKKVKKSHVVPKTHQTVFPLPLKALKIGLLREYRPRTQMPASKDLSDSK